MKRFILAGIAAAGLATAVSARNSGTVPAKAPDRGAAQESAFADYGSGRQLALETIERLTPDAGPDAPQVAFAFRSFDPATDTLSPADASEMNDMATWQLQILDRGGRKVDFIQGRGQPPAPLLSWSGLAKDGEPFPSGFYAARFIWTDRAKKVHSTQAVSFNLFSPLKIPQFAELKLQFRFTGDMSLL